MTAPSSSPILPKTMKAVLYGGDSDQNDRLVLRTNIAAPKRSADDEKKTVIVRVHAAGLNPVDAKNVIGDKLPRCCHALQSAWERRYLSKKIPGFDFCGRVVHAPDGVGIQPGDAVYGTVPPFCGTLAEYIAVPMDQMCFKPFNLSLEQAAALPLVGLTALQVLRRHVTTSSVVLVIGASGGTGHVAVQVCMALGARRIVAVSSSENAALCRQHGATATVDYRSPTFLSDLKYRGPYSFVLDCVTSADPRDSETIHYPTFIQQHRQSLLTHDYAYRRLGGPSMDWLRSGLERITGVDTWCGSQERLFWIRLPNSAAELRQLQEWVEAGKLTPDVSQVCGFTTEEVNRAFDAILGRRVKGKVVVRIADETSRDKHFVEP